MEINPMIYFVLNTKTNSVKIGTTENLNKRLPQLQTSSDDLLVVILTLQGDCELEKRLHLRFSEFRLKGEWFSFSEEVKRFVNETHCKSISTKGDVVIEPSLTEEEALLRKIKKEEYIKLQRRLIKDELEMEHRIKLIKEKRQSVKQQNTQTENDV
jgi:hypothetical protein